MFRPLYRKLTFSIDQCTTIRSRSIHFTKEHLSDNRQDREETSATLGRIKRELAADKEALKWRKEREVSFENLETKLKAFENSEQNSDFITLMQQPFDLSPSGLKRWWKKRAEKVERHMQQYVPERHEILGADLATAHFLLYRGGAVKFMQKPGWLRADKNKEFNLPRFFDPSYKLEAIRCDNMNLFYEGLENLRNLQFLKFLSFHNVKEFDDWCLDRVSGSQLSQLEVLDISGTKCTYKGLSCLYRIPTLKVLVLDDPCQTLEFELSCSMLEETLPNLKITKAEVIHDVEKIKS